MRRRRGPCLRDASRCALERLLGRLEVLRGRRLELGAPIVPEDAGGLAAAAAELLHLLGRDAALDQRDDEVGRVLGDVLLHLAVRVLQVDRALAELVDRPPRLLEVVLEHT